MSAQAFYYRGTLLATGQRVSDVVLAPSREEALRELIVKRGLVVTWCEGADSNDGLAVLQRFTVGLTRWYWGLSLADARLTFFRSFSKLVKHGASVERALALAMRSCRNLRFREALRAIYADRTQHGLELNEAMAKHPAEFTPIQLAMITVGERGADFSGTLERIASVENQIRKTRNSVQRALFYPMFVFLGMIGLILYLSQSFVPQFTRLVHDLGQKTPWQTVMLAKIGSLLSSPLFITGVLAAIGGAIYGIRAFLGTRSGALVWDNLRFRLPVVGAIFRKTVVARASRLMAAMMHAGVPTNTMLGLLIPALGSALFARGVEIARSDLRANGGRLADAFGRTRLFEPEWIELVLAGEEAESPDEMLMQLADDYDDDVETALALAGQALEPILLGVLGVGVAIILSFVYGPLYQLISNVK